MVLKIILLHFYIYVHAFSLLELFTLISLSKLVRVSNPYIISLSKLNVREGGK